MQATEECTCFLWGYHPGFLFVQLNLKCCLSHKNHTCCLWFCAVPPTINKGDISGMGLSPKEVKIKINHSLTLECEVHAIPAAAISWYKDGQASHKLNFF